MNSAGLPALAVLFSIVNGLGEFTEAPNDPGSRLKRLSEAAQTEELLSRTPQC